MWISKANRSYEHMNGLSTFYLPILRNSYFALEKQNSTFLITDKRLLPKEYFENKEFKNKDDNNNNKTDDNLKKLCKTFKEKGAKGLYEQVKEQQKSITAVFKDNKHQLKHQQKLFELNNNNNNNNEKIAMETFGLPGNDIMVPFSSLTNNNNNNKQHQQHQQQQQQQYYTPINYNLIQRIWIRLIPYIPTSWLLKPNEGYRIVSYINPLEPIQISASSNLKDIEQHWQIIDHELFNSLKTLATVDEKQFRLDSFLNIKLHSFPTRNN